MALSTAAKTAIGLLAALGALGIAYAANAAPPAAPAPSTTVTLRAGERYRVTVSGPAAVIMITPATLQPVFDQVQIGAVRVVSASIWTPNPQSDQYVIDALQNVSVDRVWLGEIAFPGLDASLFTVLVEDLGPTPTSSAAPASPAAAPPASPPGVLTPPASPPPASPPATPGPALPPPHAVTQTAANAALLAAGTATWQQLTPINAGDRGRVLVLESFAAPRLAAFAPAGGAVGRAAWDNLLLSPAVVALLGPSMLTWGPDDPLPPDWPAEDTNRGYRLEWLSQNAAVGVDVPTLGAALTIDVATIWKAVGSGPAAATRPAALTWSPASTLNPGDLVRISIASADIAAIAAAVGFSAPTPSCAALASLAAFTGFDQALTGDGSQHVLAWCGADFLPPDWPPSDDLSQYHLEFRYGGAAPVAVSALPFPTIGAWVGA